MCHKRLLPVHILTDWTGVQVLSSDVLATRALLGRNDILAPLEKSKCTEESRLVVTAALIFN